MQTCLLLFTFLFGEISQLSIKISGFIKNYPFTSVVVFNAVVFDPGLQATRLGTYIEDRVNKYLKRQNYPEAGEVFVRVVASSDKMVEVKPGMKAR